MQLMRAPHPLVTVARLRSESTSQFTALALNKPSSSSSKLSLLLLLHDITVQWHGEIGGSRPRERSTAGPVSYTQVARSRSESTSQFTALALDKPSSSYYCPSLSYSAHP